MLTACRRDQAYGRRPYTWVMRRLAPTLALVLLGLLAGGAALLSWHQAHERTLTIFDCGDQGLNAPRSFILSCADANSELKDLQWTHWGQSVARATGTATWNDCTPTCAAGTWRSASISVSAYRVRDGHYTRLIGRHSRLFSGGPFDASIYPPSG